MVDHLDFLAPCRMVLLLPVGDGADLLRMEQRGIPTVGLGSNEPVAARLREKGTAAYSGPWRSLHQHRHKFDGAWVDLDAFAGSEHRGVMRAVDEAVAPGGRLVIRRAGNVETHRKDRATFPTAPGLVIGPYADLFAGCRSVVELGTGSGAFLDAVQIRDATCLGIEQDAELAAMARARGHEVLVGGLPELLACRDREIDGIYVGNVIEQVPADQLPSLLAVLRAVLGPNGRAVLRAEREFVRQKILPAIDDSAWTSSNASHVPRDERDAALLMFAGDAAVAAPSPVANPHLPTRELPIHALLGSWYDLERFERRVTSQCGEDGILAAIFARCGTTNRFYVEFGCGDGVECNTRQLQLGGWRGLLMDGAVAPGAADVVVHAHWITAENINQLLDQHDVPSEPDLMSIDLDGNDYWVWSAITRRPRVVIAEYNGNLAADRALTIPYDPEHQWDGSDYYGASLLALTRLARQKGYTLVYCTQSGVNAFFVRDDLAGAEIPVDPITLHRPANYWYRGGRSVPDLSRAMIEV